MKYILMTIISLTLLACDRQEKQPVDPDPTKLDYDNTGINARDVNLMTKTPLDQSENEIDRGITQRIRKAIISQDSLSTNAKNIKIITINGVATLRGPVNSDSEKRAISKIVDEVPGILEVDNQIEVIRKKL